MAPAEDDGAGSLELRTQLAAYLACARGVETTSASLVVSAGSVSKTLDPRLRLGWLALPHDLVDPVRAMTVALTGGVPLLDQLALAELIRSGDYERHVRRQRREYARRHGILHSAARRAGITVPGIPAGLQALVPLPEAQGAGGVIQVGDLITHSVSRYARHPGHPPAAVIGFATPSLSAFPAAIDT